MHGMFTEILMHFSGPEASSFLSFQAFLQEQKPNTVHIFMEKQKAMV